MDWKLVAILVGLVALCTQPWWIDKVIPSTRGNSMRVRWIIVAASLVVGMILSAAIFQILLS